MNDNGKKNDKPLVSVVIPTHNRADSLSIAVESVLNQTYRELEVIIVSDGSDDNTDLVAKQLREMDSRVIFIEYHPAKGANVARNTGIANAKGELIAFLDDDDEWKKEKIEKQINKICNDDIGIVYTGAEIVYEKNNVRYYSCGNKEGDLSRDILLENCIGTTSSVMLKKSILERTGYFDETLPALQDFELWIRVCQIAKVSVIDEPLIVYYNDLGKVQISSSTQKYIDAFDCINNKHARLFEGLSPNLKKEKERNETYLLANKAMRNGNSHLARRYIISLLKRGISLKPLLYFALTFFDYRIVLKMRRFF